MLTVTGRQRGFYFVFDRMATIGVLLVAAGLRWVRPGLVEFKYDEAHIFGMAQEIAAGIMTAADQFNADALIDDRTVLVIKTRNAARREESSSAASPRNFFATSRGERSRSASLRPRLGSGASGA